MYICMTPKHNIYNGLESDGLWIQQASHICRTVGPSKVVVSYLMPFSKYSAFITSNRTEAPRYYDSQHQDGKEGIRRAIFHNTIAVIT